MRLVTIGEGSAEIVEKKSRFIATAKEIHSEQEALEFLEMMRKKYWDARHNCYAYVLGKNSELQRFSDDREPQGTAGKPILEVLNGSDLRNTIIVVTRYFGGVLLGTGGLVRAYSSSASKVLTEMKEEGKILEASEGKKLSFDCSYKDAGRIDSVISARGALVISKEYAENASYQIAVRDEAEEAFLKAASDATSGSFAVKDVEELTFITDGNRAVVYKF